MNLEIFQHIDDVVELFEGKRDVYKLIAEEIKEYFDDHVFDQSKYTLNLIYRIKTVELSLIHILTTFVAKFLGEIYIYFTRHILHFCPTLVIISYTITNKGFMI